MSDGAITLVWLRCGCNELVREDTAISTKHMTDFKEAQPHAQGGSLLTQKAMLTLLPGTWDLSLLLKIPFRAPLKAGRVIVCRWGQ